MKTYAIVIAFLITGLQQAHSQENNNPIDDCSKFRSLYFEYLRLGAYEDARTFWLNAIESCGGPDSMDAGFYKNGRVIYLKIMSTIPAENTEQLELHQDSISWVYEMGTNFIDDTIWRMDYARFLLYRKDNRVSKIDSLFEGIEKIEGLAVKYYISYYKHLFSNHYNKSTPEEKPRVKAFISSKYFPLSRMAIRQKLEFQKVENEKGVTEYTDLIDLYDKYYMLMFSEPDEMLDEIIGQYDLLSEDPELKYEQLDHAIQLMDKKGCSVNEGYVNYVRSMVSLKSNANGYYRLGNLEYELGNFNAALASYTSALEQNPDSSNLYHYKIALTYYAKHDYKNAFNSAKKVSGKWSGKAMVICGNSIAASAEDCGNSTFERKANYWLANDYYVKASQAGEGVSTSKFLDLVPSDSDIFYENLDNGDIFKCDCWNESTTIRTSGS